MTKLVSRPLYQLTIALATQAVLVAAAAIVVFLVGSRTRVPWGVFIPLLAYNTIVVSLIAALLTARESRSTGRTARMIGLLLGHLSGLLLGAFLGIRHGGLFLGAAAGIVMYFVRGWISSRISSTADSVLGGLAFPPHLSSSQRLLWAARRRKNTPYFCAAAISLLALAAVLLFLRW